MKIKHYMGLILMLGTYLFINDYFQEKRNTRLLESNQKTYIQELSDLKSDLLEYQFKNKNDLKNYLESTQSSFKGIEDKLKKNNIKLRNIRTMISTTINTKDTIINIVELDSIYEKILAKKDFTVPIEYESGCFFIKAELKFSDGTSQFRSLEEKYNDTLTYVSSDYRKPHRWLFGIKTTLFSRKLYEVTLFNSCGDPTTIIIGGPAKDKKRGKSKNVNKEKQ